MKKKAVLKNTLYTNIKSCIIFYGVLLGLYLLAIVMALFDGTGYSSMSGMEFSACIFIFVVGMNSFRESFLLALQNGVSRRSFTSGKISGLCIIAAFVGTVTVVLQYVFEVVSKGLDKILVVKFVDAVYGSLLPAGAVGVLFTFLFTIILALFAVAFGYFITIAYYRMGKGLKVLISVGVPACLMLVFPALDMMLFRGRIAEAISRAVSYCMGYKTQQPWLGVLTFAVLSVVFFGLGTLLTKKATIKKS